jgi:hypothetical protein
MKDETLAQFITRLEREIKEFEMHWLAEHMDNPENYPMTMGPGEWDEQLRAFLS